jgi:molybdenum cofactor biosynthesis protein B
MSGIDETQPFLPIRIAILTVSDTRTFETDKSGHLLADRIAKAGHDLAARDIVSDDKDKIVAKLRQWIADPEINAIISTGGTGITARDVTPEAMREVCEKEIPGFGELFRYLSYQHIGISSMQSRAMAGIAGTTYLFALPGSTGACRDGWDEILCWQLDSRYRPCNLVELMSRLSEGDS